MPVIPGSRDDPAGVMRPVFDSEKYEKVLAELYRLWLVYEGQRQQEKQQKQARETYLAMQRAWMAYYAAVLAAQQGGQAMPFGQMGFQAPGWPSVGNQSSGFWGTVGDIAIGVGGTILADWLESMTPGYAETGPGPNGPATQPGGNGTVAPPSIAQQAGAGFYRQTVARIVPKPEISMIGPEGRIDTWLYARPKGWKINRCNVSGRRHRHHHHPR